MENLRATLIRELRRRLAEATVHMPDSMALAVPLGTLADAAIALFADGQRVPTVPAYNPDLAPQRRWYGVLHAEELDNGAQYPELGVRRDGPNVILTVQHGAHTVTGRMTPTDMVEFGLAILSAAYAEDAPVEPAVSDEVPTVSPTNTGSEASA